MKNKITINNKTYEQTIHNNNVKLKRYNSKYKMWITLTFPK